MVINTIQSENGLGDGLLDPDPPAQDRLNGTTIRICEAL